MQCRYSHLSRSVGKRRTKAEEQTDRTKYTAAQMNAKIWRKLRQRERQVIALFCQGLTDQEIATNLFIKENTVRVLLHSATKKFGVKNRLELYRLLLSIETKAV